MATAQQRKYKQRKRTHHQKSTGYGRDAVNYIEPYGTVIVGEPKQGKEIVKVEAPLIDKLTATAWEENLIEALGSGDVSWATVPLPSRALCGYCGKSEKLRKDGTVSAHGPMLERCQGSGQPYAGAL